MPSGVVAQAQRSRVSSLTGATLAGIRCLTPDAARQEEFARLRQGFAEKPHAQCPLGVPAVAVAHFEEREVAPMHEVVAMLGNRYQLAAHARAEPDCRARDV